MENNKTNIIIKLIIILIFNLSYGQTVYYDNSSKLYGIIDRNGKNILPPSYNQMSSFDNGISRFEKNNKWGLINEKGLIILKPEFDDLYSFCYEGFSEGLISAKKDGKYGYYDFNGKMIISHLFDLTQQFCNGFAWVQINEKYSFINKSGKYITDKWFDDIKIIKGVTYITDKNGEYYKITKEGNIVLEKNQEYVKTFDTYYMDYCDIDNNSNIPLPLLVPFKDEKNRLMGYKDAKDNIVQKSIYYAAFPFEDGVSIVMLKNSKNPSKFNFQIINDKLQIIKSIDEKYDDFYSLRSIYINGLCEFKSVISKSDRQEEKYEYVFMDKKGEIIKTMDKEALSAFPGGG
ncbi:WG repeat-containing protein [Flavobacterium sp.]|jgi:hypothetical protein|uniref:WG repeat-containing protein n=1 Tax=Flavobacterium sp. TaxID=239 RepID=UPI0037C17B67